MAVRGCLRICSGLFYLVGVWFVVKTISLLSKQQVIQKWYGRNTDLDQIQKTSHLTPSSVPGNNYNTEDRKHDLQLLVTGTCRKGFFKLSPMRRCDKWLECDEILRIIGHTKKIGGGIGKLVYAVQWWSESCNEMLDLALVEIRATRLKHQWIVDRVQKGVKNVIDLQPSKHVIQVAGYCKTDTQTYLVTERCKKYENLERFLKTKDYKNLSVQRRFELVIQLTEAFVLLHHKSGKPKVHCDLHDPQQAFGQFLVTDEMRVVLNDVDELPYDEPQNNYTAMCLAESNCIMKHERFLAPEQRYTQEYCKTHKQLQAATVKSDVWKIPYLSHEMLNAQNSSHVDELLVLNKHLEKLYQNCHNISPANRWTSLRLLNEFIMVYHKLYGDS